ncbi:uncharacterized protein BDV17DRAFT_249603 [Aspergillus undulatus]|uniref:uncharacterized protein n=1 Tax=Aspergillus undulatus TaxID=1810928 RepID=UPI003CCCF1BE
MEQKAVELVSVLRNNNLSIDAKVTHLLGLKSDIKQKNVPQGAVPPIFEALQVSIASPHSAMYTAGFSTLGHFIKRLVIQEMHNLISFFAKDLVSCLMDRLSDHKKRIRDLSQQALIDVQPFAPQQVEDGILTSFKAKSPTVKEACLLLVDAMGETLDLPFRQYVPDVVACLCDPHYPEVRETAKSVLIRLFTDAPGHAKQDLKRQMTEMGIKDFVQGDIYSKIGLEVDHPIARPASTRPPSVRPPSRGDAIRRPPSRGDALYRPPSRGDVLHRPPSRGDVLRKAPPKMKPTSTTTDSEFVTGPGPVDHHSTQISHHHHNLTVAGPAPAEDSHTPLYEYPVTDDVANAPAPAFNNVKAPKVANSLFDQRTAPKTPHYTDLEHGDKAVPRGVVPRDISSVRELEQIVREMLPCFEGREDETNWQKREKNVKLLRCITWGNAPHDFTQAYLKEIKSMYDGIFKVANSLRTSLQTTGLLTLQSLAVVNESRLDPSMDLIMPHAIKLCSTKKKITSENGNLTVIILLQNVTCNSRILQHVQSAASDSNTSLRLYSAGWFAVIINGQERHKTTPEGVAEIAQCIKKGVSDAKDDIRAAYRSTFWDFYRFWPDKALQILEEVNPKIRSMIEKDPANQMDDPFFSSSTSSLPSSTPGRLATKGVIARGKASLPAVKNFPPPAMAGDAAHPHKKLRPAATATPTTSLTSAPMRPGASKPRAARNDLAARPATATGFHRKQTESTPRGSPVRKSAAQPSTPSKSSLGPTRPRQKSDPLQNASPAKMSAHETMSKEPHSPKYPSNHSSTHPYETINIPKRRTKKDDGDVVGNKTDENERKNISEDTIQNKLENGNENESAASMDTPVSVIPSPREVSVSEAIEAEVDVKEAFRGAPSDDKDNDERIDVDEETTPPKAVTPAADDETAASNAATSAAEILLAQQASSAEAKAPEVPPVRKRTSVLSARDWSSSADDDDPEDSVWAALATAARSGEPVTMADVRAVRRISDRWRPSPSARRDISPRSQDPEQAPEMLVKATDRIKRRDLDMTGYRRLQGLLAFHQDTLFKDREQFDDVLMSLLGELKTPALPLIQTMPFGTKWDYKIQILCTVKCMFLYASKYFDVSSPFIVTELLQAEKLEDMTRRFEKAVDGMIDDIVARNEPFSMIDSVLYFLGMQKDPGHKVFQKGFDVIGHALVKLNEKKQKLDEGTLKRIGRFAVKSLKDETPGVQRRVVAMCVELRMHVEDQDRFWEIMGLDEMKESERGMRALFYYYESKKRAGK